MYSFLIANLNRHLSYLCCFDCFCSRFVDSIYHLLRGALGSGMAAFGSSSRPVIEKSQTKSPLENRPYLRTKLE